MADFVRSFRDGVLTIRDGTGTPNEAEVVVAEGDLTIKLGKEHLEIKDRGNLHEIKKGDEIPMEVSFSAKFHGFDKPTGVGPYEALTKTNDASAWVGTRDATSDVYTVDLRFELKGVDGSVDETVDIPDFYWSSIEFTEGDPSMLSVAGKSWATEPTIS